MRVEFYRPDFFVSTGPNGRIYASMTGIANVFDSCTSGVSVSASFRFEVKGKRSKGHLKFLDTFVFENDPELDIRSATLFHEVMDGEKRGEYAKAIRVAIRKYIPKALEENYHFMIRRMK